MGNELGLSEYLGSRFSKHVTEIVSFCRIFNSKVYDGKQFYKLFCKTIYFNRYSAFADSTSIEYYRPEKSNTYNRDLP